MINIIWSFFIIIGIVSSILSGKSDLVNDEILNACKTTLDMILKLFPVIALWLGIMNITEKSGLLNKFSKLISPIMRLIFPEIPASHESLSLISSNLIANMFGLGSAATPFGLKAMKSLQELNDDKKVASKSMITFLVLNTSGMTIIPTTIISMRIMYKSNNPTEIILACFLATLISAMGGLIINNILASRDKNV